MKDTDPQQNDNNQKKTGNRMVSDEWFQMSGRITLKSLKKKERQIQILTRNSPFISTESLDPNASGWYYGEKVPCEKLGQNE